MELIKAYILKENYAIGKAEEELISIIKDCINRAYDVSRTTALNYRIIMYDIEHTLKAILDELDKQSDFHDFEFKLHYEPNNPITIAQTIVLTLDYNIQHSIVKKSVEIKVDLIRR